MEYSSVLPLYLSLASIYSDPPWVLTSFLSCLLQYLLRKVLLKVLLIIDHGIPEWWSISASTVKRWRSIFFFLFKASHLAKTACPSINPLVQSINDPSMRTSIENISVQLRPPSGSCCQVKIIRYHRAEVVIPFFEHWVRRSFLHAWQGSHRCMMSSCPMSKWNWATAA